MARPSFLAQGGRRGTWSPRQRAWARGHRARSPFLRGLQWPWSPQPCGRRIAGCPGSHLLGCTCSRPPAPGRSTWAAAPPRPRRALSAAILPAADAGGGPGGSPSCALPDGLLAYRQHAAAILEAGRSPTGTRRRLAVRLGLAVSSGAETAAVPPLLTGLSGRQPARPCSPGVAAGLASHPRKPARVHVAHVVREHRPARAGRSEGAGGKASSVGAPRGDAGRPPEVA